MPKELLNIEMERDNLGQKWGFTIQGGADLALTAKVASVKGSEVEEEECPPEYPRVWRRLLSRE